MTNQPTLDQLVEQLAQARADLERAVTDDASLELKIETAIAKQFGSKIADAKLACADASMLVDDLTAQVRQAALAAFEQTGDKKPNAAVQIKEYVLITYEDAAALEFCRKVAPNALKLDRRAFEKIAKLGIEAGGQFAPDFVTVTKEPRASIASDLSPWLPTEGELTDG